MKWRKDLLDAVVTKDELEDWSSSGGVDHGGLGGLADDDHTQYLLAAGTRALSGDWDAGGYEIRSNTFESDVATGTAPFTVASTTNVTNLNSDTVDGIHAAGFVPTPLVLPTSGNMVIWSSDGKVTEDPDVTNSNVLTYIGVITKGNIPEFSDIVLPPPNYLLIDSGKAVADFALSSHTHVEADILDLNHKDIDAIHDNAANEISAITEKTTPANDDLFVIEDSEASYVKKRLKISNLPGGAGGLTQAQVLARGLGA
jgi:hypothetical protein